MADLGPPRARTGIVERPTVDLRLWVPGSGFLSSSLHFYLGMIPGVLTNEILNTTENHIVAISS